MIARDEADCIGRCLASAKGICDEIILIDTGSKDRTIEIAEKEFGAKVTKIEWPKDFSIARNISIEKAEYDWILVLDADETISAGDAAKIRGIVDRDEGMIYNLVQTTYIAESAIYNWISNELKEEEAQGYPGYFESPLARLFKNDPKIRYQGVVHENAMHSDRAIVAIASDIRIHHYGKFISDERRREKGEHYLELGINKCRENPKDTKAQYELAVQLWDLGRSDEALLAVERCLELDPKYMDALFVAASLETERKRYANALNYYSRILSIDESSRHAYTFLPSVLIDMGDMESAGEALSMGDKMGLSSPAFYVNKSVFYMRRKEWRRATMYCRKALLINQNDALAHLNMGSIMVSEGNDQQAKGEFERALEDYHVAPLARIKLGEMALQSKDWKGACNHLEKLLDTDLVTDDVKIKLAIAYINAGRKDAAKGCVRGLDMRKTRTADEAKAIEWCKSQLT